MNRALCRAGRGYSGAHGHGAPRARQLGARPDARVRDGSQALRHPHARRARRRDRRAPVPLAADGDLRRGSPVPGYVPAAAGRVPLENVTETKTDVTSFAKALVLGEIHEDLVFPYPLPG